VRSSKQVGVHCEWKSRASVARSGQLANRLNAKRVGHIEGAMTKVRALLSLAALAWGAATVSGCGDDGGEATGSTCPSDSALTYDNFGAAFFQSNCLVCHGSNGPESPKFDTVEQIRAHIGEIDEQAAAGPNAVNTNMPESGSVSEADRRKLGEWLACGAP
jgi:mono/diheme cytochrome c family protein